MRKSKYLHYVFSVYSTALGNYPYYPFVAKNVTQAIHKFIRFCSNRESICDGAELHLIGTCEIHKDSDTLENIQPYIVPKKVQIKDNLIGKCFVLVDCKIQSIHKYFKLHNERRTEKWKINKK